MNAKDKKIIEDAEREGIPIFVFTAKDVLSLDVILDYEVKCFRAKCGINHTEGVHERFNEFLNWQKENSGKVKLPE